MDNLNGEVDLVCIGIDFGTITCKTVLLSTSKSTSSYVLYAGSNASRHVVPACVAYSSVDLDAADDASMLEPCWGVEALQIASNSDAAVVRNIKRILGKTFPEIQEDRASWPLGCVTLDEKNGDAVIMLRNNVAVTVFEVAVSLMFYLKLSFQKEVGGYIDAAIVTVPTYFNDTQHKAVSSAASEAGFSKVLLLQETTAIAASYADQQQVDRIAVIVDVGGGGSSLSLIKSAKNCISVLATSDVHLPGGIDFDAQMVEWLTKVLIEDHGEAELNDQQFVETLRMEMSKTKEELSRQREALLSVRLPVSNTVLSKEVTRLEFETQCNDLFLKITDYITILLKKGKVSVTDVHHIVLHGGCTQITRLREMLKNSLPLSNVYPSMNPELSVVNGLALLQNGSIKVCQNSLFSSQPDTNTHTVPKNAPANETKSSKPLKKKNDVKDKKISRDKTNLESCENEDPHSEGEGSVPMPKYYLDMKEVLVFKRDKKYPERLRQAKNGKRSFRLQCANYFYHDATDKLYYKRQPRKKPERDETGDIIQKEFDLAGARVVIVDAAGREEAIRLLHEGKGSSLEAGALLGHRGRDALNEALRARYFWPGMYVQLQEFCQNCEICRLVNPSSMKVSESMHPVGVPSRVMAQIGIDLTSLDEVDGLRYVAVAIDYFSKWSEARGLPNKAAPTVARFIYEDILSRHGFVETIICDQGKEFCNSLMDEIYRLTGTRLRVTSPYHPQANGLVERQNRTIKNKLLKVLNGHIAHWPKVLPGVLFAHRSSVHSSTKFSPFFMLYKRQPRLQCDVENIAEDEDEEENAGEQIALEEIEEEEEPFDVKNFNAVLLSYEQVRREVEKAADLHDNKVQAAATKNIKEAQVKQKRDYDARHTGGQRLRVGQSVHIVNARRLERKGGKSELPKTGPYTIFAINEEKKTVEVKNKLGIVLKTKYSFHHILPIAQFETKLKKINRNPETCENPTTMTDADWPETLRKENLKRQHTAVNGDEGIGNSPPNKKKAEPIVILSDQSDDDALGVTYMSLPRDVDEQEVQNILTLPPSTVIIKMQRVEVTAEDLQKLHSDTLWLTDNVINFYLNLICIDHEEIYCFNTFFYEQLLESYEKVKNWTKHVNIFKYVKVFVPVHEPGHWYLSVINMSTKQIAVYNSIDDDEKSNTVFYRLLDYMASEHKDKSVSGNFRRMEWTRSNVSQITQQGNSYDCGVFLCYYARHVANDKLCRDPDWLVHRLRKQMVLEILACKLKEEQYLMVPYLQALIHNPESVLYKLPQKLVAVTKIGAGLTNIGNTCFINAILQVLFHCSPFITWLMDDSIHRSSCTDEACVTCTIFKLFTLTQTCDNPVVPKAFVEVLLGLWETYEKNSQEDAQEFFSVLLLALEREFLQRFRNMQYVLQRQMADMLDDIHVRETGPVSLIFGGHFRNDVSCQECCCVSTTYTQFHMLHISAAHGTLQSGLEFSMQDEVISGYQCKSCLKPVVAKKTLKLENTPRVLVLHVIRTVREDGQLDKNYVNQTPKINITKLVHWESPLRTQNHQYKFFGAVEYKETEHHFVATAQAKSYYYCFNDSLVSKTTLGQIMRSKQYMLFYVKF